LEGTVGLDDPRFPEDDVNVGLLREELEIVVTVVPRRNASLAALVCYFLRLY